MIPIPVLATPLVIEFIPIAVEPVPKASLIMPIAVVASPKAAVLAYFPDVFNSALPNLLLSIPIAFISRRKVF